MTRKMMMEISLKQGVYGFILLMLVLASMTPPQVDPPWYVFVRNGSTTFWLNCLLIYFALESLFNWLASSAPPPDNEEDKISPEN